MDWVLLCNIKLFIKYLQQYISPKVSIRVLKVIILLKQSICSGNFIAFPNKFNSFGIIWINVG